jgi:hypothetical protein
MHVKRLKSDNEPNARKVYQFFIFVCDYSFNKILIEWHQIESDTNSIKIIVMIHGWVSEVINNSYSQIKNICNQF